METLNDILDAYAASTPGPSFETLREWVRRYPEFESELTEFTIDWRLLHALSPSAQATADEETLVLRGMSIVEGLLHSQRMQATKERDPGSRVNGTELLSTPPHSLLGAADERGITLDDFAQKTGLSASLIASLNNRLARVNSIPRQIVESVAHVIGRSVEAVFAYLQRPPTLPPAAQYKADQTPTVASQRDFFELVHMDKELTEQQKQQLLALTPNEG